MERIGVINIGSNVIRLMLSEVEEDGYFKIIDELHSTLTFCYDCERNHPISQEVLDKIIATLKSFKNLSTASGAFKIILTATENFRLEANKITLVNTIKKELDLDVNVLSFEDETRYTTLGATRTMKINNSILVYVGRIITHVVKIKDNNLVNYHTLPFGSMDISYKFNLSDRILSNDISNAIEFINSHIIDIPWLSESDFESIVISGELARNIHKISKKRKRYPLSIEHYYTLDSFEIHDIYNTLKSKDRKQRYKVEGLDYELSDIVVGGISILHSIVTLTNTDKIVISSAGLREGILYDYILNNYDVLEDNLNYSISGILNNLNINKTHAMHVYILCKQLYEGLKPLHKIDEKCLNILKTGALLHDSGVSIGYENHHHNSFFIIMNSTLNNLTHRELLMSAGVAASHRFNTYQMPCTQFSSIINKLDIKIVEIFGVLLKIAEGLDRSLINNVEKIDTIINDDSVVLLLSSKNNLDLEINQAMRAKYAFYDIFNKDLIIKQK